MLIVEMPAISVIIPVYRVEKYLHECVESVLAQDFRDFEIILVDDESPDNCPQMCDEYAQLYPESGGFPSVHVVHKRNGGLGMARNSGLEIARGKYVFFLDSDDTIRRDALQCLYEVAERTGAQAVHGRLARFVKSGTYSINIFSGKENIIATPAGLRMAALTSFSSFPGDEQSVLEGSSCGALYDLKFLRDNNILFRSEREYISEDYIFNYDVARHARILVQIPDTIYYYRINPASLTQSPKADVIQRIVDFCEQIEAMMLRDGFGAQAAHYAFGYAASRIRAQYKYMFRAPGSLKSKLKLARQWRSNPYFERMAREFDAKSMSRLHRLNYALFRSGSFRSLYGLLRIQQLQRKLTGHIGD